MWGLLFTDAVYCSVMLYAVVFLKKKREICVDALYDDDSVFYNEYIWKKLGVKWAEKAKLYIDFLTSVRTSRCIICTRDYSGFYKYEDCPLILFPFIFHITFYSERWTKPQSFHGCFLPYIKNNSNLGFLWPISMNVEAPVLQLSHIIPSWTLKTADVGKWRGSALGLHCYSFSGRGTSWKLLQFVLHI